MADPKFDVTAFMDYHPDGQFGLHDDRRKIKLTPAKYFSQRILNMNPKFAQDPEYVFMAEQYVERFELERQINIAMLKGSVQKSDGGSKFVSDDNVYSILKSIPMTPSYWRVFRSEIFARMEQLGPFHIFFTLSCAESKWAEVYVAILEQEGFVAKYLPDADTWNGEMDTVMIYHKDDYPDGINLLEYKKFRCPTSAKTAEFMK